MLFVWTNVYVLWSVVIIKFMEMKSVFPKVKKPEGSHVDCVDDQLHAYNLCWLYPFRCGYSRIRICNEAFIILMKNVRMLFLHFFVKIQHLNNSIQLFKKTLKTVFVIVYNSSISHCGFPVRKNFFDHFWKRIGELLVDLAWSYNWENFSSRYWMLVILSQVMIS